MRSKSMKTRIALLGGMLVFVQGAAPSPPPVGSASASPATPYARVHHPTSSSSAVAQGYFDQGLTLLYGFSREAARRAFNRASAADPSLAMAYWGVAMSYGSNINFPQDAAGERAAYAAIQKALALSATATPPERD